MAKAKRLTVREKKYRAELRKDMREKGMLPPVKQKLNRRKFIKEVRTEYAETFDNFEDIIYLYKAINWMLPSGESKYKIPISPEEIGVAKLLKIALEIKKFSENMRANGKKEYKVIDLYNTVIKPIRDL